MSKLNTILLVDDNEMTNFMHRIIIEKMGCTDKLVIVENGEEALAYLTNPQNTTPDLIFLDINMPVMNGWEFLEEYQYLNEGKKAKIVLFMLSTSMSPSDKKRADENEVIRGYINKPLSENKVKTIIKQYLG
ncbi:MAG: response regulator [Chitinophagales bacterium]